LLKIKCPNVHIPLNVMLITLRTMRHANKRADMHIAF
jgi:hypothetical protein